MDEIQYAPERYRAIHDVDRNSTVLREVKAALRRIHTAAFGLCVECERALSAKRLLAGPFAGKWAEAGKKLDAIEADVRK